MNARTLTTIAVAVMLAVAAGGAGVAAAVGSTGTQSPADTSDTFADDEDVNESVEGNVSVDTTYDNGTVTVTVTRNGSGVEGVEVSSDEFEGETGADGAVTFETNASEELEIELAHESFEAELTYEIEDGSLTLVESEYEYEYEAEADNDDENETANGSFEDAQGPDENASDTAHTVWGIIQKFVSGELENQSLGAAISGAVSNAPEDAGKPDDVGNASDDAGAPDEAGNASDEAGNASDEAGDAPDDAGEEDEE